MYKQKTINTKRINLEADKLQNGLAKLVLTLVEVLRQVLEKEALRRVESGTLSVEEVDRLGLAFMQIKQKVYELSREFGVNYEELDVNLGLLRAGNKSLDNVSLVDVIDKLLYKKVAIIGKVKISVANIDLVILDLLAVLSTATALRVNNSAKAVRNID
ncbi:MAG: hypothetical protein HMLIMOIP_001182 [Candidatus Nitrosomirales archaeon]|jgi:hypothetical protein